MAASYFFYDLETSGFSASEARVMQFAGQRTNENLEPIGEPVNVLIKLAADVLPNLDAILLTSITPQQTLNEGLTEAEFLKYFYEEVVKSETTFLGFNSVRFDDEFMRYLHWRNFYDPYEWHWTNSCSRWDILDLVRMTRALRPDGIEWPFTPEGKPTNRLELLTKANNLEHEHAHDALSDVYATINITKLIRTKQPDLFKYLFGCRSKKEVSDVLLAGKPFVYTSGKYAPETLNTSAAALLVEHPRDSSGLVYDLRVDPTEYAKMSPQQLADAWRFNPDKTAAKFPVKTLKYNRCPAIAPLGVMNKPEVEERLQLTVADAMKNFAILQSVRAEFGKKILEAVKIMDVEREQAYAAMASPSPDGQLYNGFLAAGDKSLTTQIRKAQPTELGEFLPKLHDERLKLLLPLYKARNYPKALTADERAVWDEHCADALFTGGNSSQLALYFADITERMKNKDLTENQRYILEELQLYGESIVPSDAAA